MTDALEQTLRDELTVAFGTLEALHVKLGYADAVLNDMLNRIHDPLFRMAIALNKERDGR